MNVELPERDRIQRAQRRPGFCVAGGRCLIREILAAFGDVPGGPSPLLSAYERLAAYLTDGEVTSLGPMDRALRRRTLARYEK